MTLLIETMSNDHAMLTADGLSIPNRTTGAGINRDDLQKIFPLSNVPIAIAHHGINLIDGCEVSQLISEFEKSLGQGLSQYSVPTIAKNLRAYTDLAAKSTLANPANEGCIGFWVTGFAQNNMKPLFYEVLWPNEPSVVEHYDAVFGGGGKKFIERYLNNRLGKFDLRQAHGFKRVYAGYCHDALYREAEAAQRRAGERIFGGHQHRLLIRKGGCQWLKSPKAAIP